MLLRHAIKILGLASALFASGCAVHPNIKDVTGVPTVDIVQQIRCETRQAFIELAQTYLAKGDVDTTSRERGAALAAEIANDPEAARKLNPNLFTGEARRSLSIFWTTGVAYNFRLDMTEVDNADGEIDVGSLFGRRLFGFGIKAGLDRSRQNIRTFTVTDTVSDIIPNLRNCEGQIVGPNLVYPISGQIGVKSMIQTFVFMSIFGNLAAETTTPATMPKGPPTLVDSLLFTTTISGSLNPHVAFAPVDPSLGITAANLDLHANRTDKHQVVVGLALASAAQGQLAALRQAGMSPYTSTPGATLVAPLLTAPATTKSEQAAATAVNQFLTQQLFSPTIILP